MNKLPLAIVAASMAAAVSANANLVLNGGFETHDAYNGSNWNYFYGGAGNSVANWSSGSPGVPLEVGQPSVYGVSGVGLGNAVMELDTTHNVIATQVLAPTPGTYTLSFLYGLRSGVNPASGTLNVYWNNVLVASLSPTSTVMGGTSYTINAIAGNNTLSFQGTGIDDSYGALIDNVDVSAVPEPSTVIAGALLLLPFGTSALRILRSKRNS